ncbi:hypothetical protein KUW09_04910 [Mameliella alba]|nr:hypothetical protein [Antarctobacter heliothermus]MBY6143369.1 hypothetical protein [Mameliella alba]MCA0952906.1 hypothetical protein [Mameliella alba]
MSNVDWNRVVTAEDKAAQGLQVAREGARMSRLDFALAMRTGGVITKAEAAAWLADGTLPPVAQAAIATIADQAKRDEAELRFIAAAEIERQSPLITLVQAQVGLTDAQVDALFGIQ